MLLVEEKKWTCGSKKRWCFLPTLWQAVSRVGDCAQIKTSIQALAWGQCIYASVFQLKICLQLDHVGDKVLKEMYEGKMKGILFCDMFWTYKPITPSGWHSFLQWLLLRVTVKGYACLHSLSVQTCIFSTCILQVSVHWKFVLNRIYITRLKSIIHKFN